MPVIKTVKPDGTGDYTTIQEWWDWAKTQTDPAQWAECYGGGDLGGIDTSANPPSFTATSTDYPKIYAAPGNRHNLTASTSFAHTNSMLFITVPYFEIDGLLFYTAASQTGLLFQSTGSVTIKNCLTVGSNNNDNGMYMAPSTGTYTIYNCLAYGHGGSGFVSDCVGIVSIYNSGTVNCGNNASTAVFRCGYLAQRANHIYINCYAINNTGGYGVGWIHGGLGGTPQVNYCASFDATADDWGGGNNVLSIDSDLQLNNILSDWKTLDTSDFVNVGDDLSSDFTTDVLGNARNVPWWIGPYQYFDIVISTIGTGKDYSSIQAWWNDAKTSKNPNQWAECYSGELGALSMTGPVSFTSSLTEHPKIYSHSTARPTLTVDVNAAYTNSVWEIYDVVNHITIDGISFYGPSNANALYFDGGGSFSNVMNCQFYGNSGGSGSRGYLSFRDGNNYIQNCLFYRFGIAGVYTDLCTTTIYNCGAVNCGWEDSTFAYGGFTSNRSLMYITNSYAISTVGGIGFNKNGSSTLTTNYCAAHDATPDSYGSNNVINVDSTIQLVSLTSDWKTLNTSDFVGAGDDLSAEFTTDIFGTTRNVPWWIGPYQISLFDSGLIKFQDGKIVFSSNKIVFTA